MKIVAFVGEIGSGKGYQMTQYLERVKTNGFDVLCVSFAGELKLHFLYDFGLYRDGNIDEDVYNARMSNTYKDIYNREILYISRIMNMEEYYSDEDWNEELFKTAYEAIKAKDVRKTLQYYGTEFAQQHDNLIWVKYLFENMKYYEAVADYLLIDDMRFVQEYEYVKEHFGDDFECYGVVASEEARAKRRGCTVEELREMSCHESEKQVKKIIDMLPKECIIENS